MMVVRLEIFDDTLYEASLLIVIHKAKSTRHTYILVSVYLGTKLKLMELRDVGTEDVRQPIPPYTHPVVYPHTPCRVYGVQVGVGDLFYSFFLSFFLTQMQRIGKGAVKMVRSAQAVLHHASTSTAAGTGADAWRRLQCRPFHGSARALGMFDGIKQQV